MLLLGLEMSALYLLFKNDESPAFWRTASAFSLMGLAILAKGPVGLIVPSGIYITAHFFSNQKRQIFRSHWLWGIPLSLLWPAMWLLLAKLNGAPPEYFNELLFDQNVGRFAGKFGGHYKPFYYYLKYLLIDFLPWTFFIPATIVLLIKEKRYITPSFRLLGWIIFVVVFSSMCGGKRNLYIISVYPAASLLVASALPRMKDMSRRWSGGTLYSLLILICLLSVSGLLMPLFASLPVPFTVFLPNIIIFLSGAALLFHTYRHRGLDQRWFNLFIIILIATELCTGTIVFPAFNTVKTPVALAETAQRQLSENSRLLFYQMNGEILALYSKRQGRRINDFDRLLKEMERTGKGIVVFSKKKWEKMKENLLQWGDAHSFQMGHKKLVWLEYRRSGI